jgi:hypothetical protein
MEKEPSTIFKVFRAVCWVMSGFFFIVFLINLGWIPKTPVTIYDLSYLIASFVYFVLPIVSRLKLGNLVDIETKPLENKISKDEVEKRGLPEELPTAIAERPNTAMEYKILNTLWNKQVGKFPDLDVFFTFRLNTSATEFLEFREAGNRLMGKGLISETDIGQFHLTSAGLQYCSKNYKTFPADMWFKYESLYQDNLGKVLKKLNE